MAISWMYREDYGRAGFAMTSVRDDNGTATARQAILYSLALLAVSVFHRSSAWRAGGVSRRRVVAGTALFAASVGFFFDRTTASLKLFMTSNIYLLVMMAAFVLATRN